MKLSILKRVSAFTLAAALTAACLPSDISLESLLKAGIPTADAATAENISYLYYTFDSENEMRVRHEGNCESAIEMDSSMSTLSSGWYVVNSDVTINNLLVIPDETDVNIILVNGCTLTCNKGIYVEDHKSNTTGGQLYIYGQEYNNGKLVTKGQNKQAGIGGSDKKCNGLIEIHGGIIEATGGNGAAGIGGGNEGDTYRRDINIYDGTVYAYGGLNAAGIGGGYRSKSPAINIYGGEIYTYGGGDKPDSCGAGIGGGDYDGCHAIKIYGGIIEAKGGLDSAGIGTGSGGTVDKILINGGKVTATGGDHAAGIGGGYGLNLTADIEINGGTVVASSGFGGAGIGSGSCSMSGGDFSGKIAINGGTVYATSNCDKTIKYGAAIGAGGYGNMKGNVTITGGTVWAESQGYAAVIGAGDEMKIFGAGGECSGTVSITGGYVHMSFLASDKNTQFIGHGQNGDESGKLVIGEGMCVSKNEVPVLSNKRTEACRNYKDCSTVVISDCNHEGGLTYTIADQNYHNATCKYCAKVEIEAHQRFDCPCGFIGSKYYSLFFKLNGYSDVMVSVGIDNSEYLMPELSSIFPDAVASDSDENGYTKLIRWYIGTPTVANSYVPGDVYTLSDDVVFTADIRKEYPVEVDNSAEGGLIWCDVDSALVGTPVLIDYEEDYLYSLNAVYISYNGQEYTLFPDEEGQCHFTMPAAKVTVRAEFDDEPASPVLGHSVSLAGNIGVNYYMVIDEEVVNRDNAYVRFKGEGVPEKKIYMDEVRNDPYVIDGVTCYKFTYDVSAKNMSTQIEAQVFNGDYWGRKYYYSVTEYAGYILENSEDYDQYTINLVKALLNYGAAAQTYFGIEEEPANSALDDADKVMDVTAELINRPYAGKTEFSDGTVFNGATLSLKNELTLSLYFTSDNELEFSCVGHTVENTTSGNYKVARIRGISASSIAEGFALNVNDYSITYSPINYCYNVLNGGSDNTKLQDVCKAVYLYSEAAHDYAEHSNS